MKNKIINGLLGFTILILIISCTKEEQNVYDYLTQEQLDFINTPKTGDTCIWQSNLGLRDTAIVMPVVIEEYSIETNRNGTKHYGQTASYDYKLIGKRKTRVGTEVRVKATHPSSTELFSEKEYNKFSEIITFNIRQFGGISYSNVIRATNYRDAEDSVFFNKNGFLAYKSGDEFVYKIK